MIICRTAYFEKGLSHIEQKLFTIGLDNDIMNKYSNITTAPYGSYVLQRLLEYQLTLTRVLKEVITLASKLEMQVSIKEILRILYSNFGWLILFGVGYLIVISVLFKWSAKEELESRLSISSILEFMKTLPPHLVFRNSSTYYLLRNLFD